MSVVLLPSAAIDRIAHEEQMTVWSGDLVGALSLGEFLRDDLAYHDVIALHDCVKREIRSILKMALQHPEAVTILQTHKTAPPPE